MGKKNKNIFNDTEYYVHGSANGWLKISDGKGKQIVLRPDFHEAGDIPNVFYNMGKFIPETLKEEK